LGSYQLPKTPFTPAEIVAALPDALGHPASGDIVFRACGKLFQGAGTMTVSSQALAASDPDLECLP
jgi:hypothetical protein